MLIPQPKLHVALLASPGLGHLIPILELAKRLATQHELTVTVFAIAPDSHNVHKELLSSTTSLWPELIDVVILPIEKQDIPPTSSTITRMFGMIRRVIPTIRSSISNMANKPVALIVDLFTTEAIETIAQEFNMLKYVLIASNARFLSFTLYLPHVNKVVHRDEPFYIPGCDPVPGEDLLELTFNPEDQLFRDYAHIGSTIAAADGILVSTWEGLEADTLLAFKDERFMKHIVKNSVYPVGPVVRKGVLTGSKTELVKWLDLQPNKSVVYVSFGSGGTLSSQQTTELAFGLELSKQRFIWVVRPPIENDSAATLFKSTHVGVDELPKYLPEGFLDRTRDVGFVVPIFAPQEEILTHGSIGAFISHCGWNSTLESIMNGVPIIAWPLYAEQRMNATMLVKKFGIAVRPLVNPSKELVKRDEIAKLVKRVMVETEGISIRTRVDELKASASKALKEGGTSYTALSEVVKKWKNNLAI